MEIVKRKHSVRDFIRLGVLAFAFAFDSMSAALQCQQYCHKVDVLKQYDNVTVITFCQLWEDKDAVIDPAIELGLRTLQRDFPTKVHFEWVKVDLPNGCNDETYLMVSPDAVELELQKSLAGCSVFMGPACTASVEQIRGLLSSWNVPVMTTEAGGITGDQKAASKLLTRLGFTQAAVTILIQKILQKYEWTNIAVIFDSDVASAALGKALENMIQHEMGQDTESSTSKIISLNSNTAKGDYRYVLNQARNVARGNYVAGFSVIIIAAMSNITRDIMLTASDLGMTRGDYVYIAVDLFYVSGQSGSLTFKTSMSANSQTEFDAGRQENFHRSETGDSNTVEMEVKKAFQSLFVVMLKMPDNAEYTEYSNELKHLSALKYHYVYPQNDKVPHSIMGFFDACRLYGIVLNETLNAKEDPQDGLAMTRKMWGRTFQGIGTEIVISETGDRVFDFYILNFDLETSQFIPVLEFVAATKSLKNIHEITWADKNGPPPNIPPCGFDGKSGPCAEPEHHNAATIPVAVVLGVAGLIAVGYLCYRFIKKDAELSSEWWRINWVDIYDLKTARDNSGSIHKSGSDLEKDDKKSKPGRNISQGLSKSSSGSSRNQIFTEMGSYKDSQVAIKRIGAVIYFNKKLLRELRDLRNLIHDHINRFVGLCVDAGNESIISEYCQKGSIADVLNKETINLDLAFRYSIISDIIEGLNYLHSSPFRSHGRLNSSNLLVDGRLVVKITDIGLWSLRKKYLVFLDPEANEAELRPLLWVAPEHLREPMPINGTPQGDIYSLSIVLQELVTMSPPYDESTLSVRDIIREVRKGTNPPMRPRVDPLLCGPELFAIMQDCWTEYPEERPNIENVKTRTQPLIRANAGNFMDNLIKRMEKYATDLETLVQERTEAFMEEKRKSEELLNQMLPKIVSEKLKRGDYIEPETFESVTVYFSTIVGFTELSSGSTAVEVVGLLNDLYTLLDGIIEGFDAYKVETIGDSYLIVSGLPIRNGTRHASELAKLSIKTLKAMRSFKVQHRPNDHIQLRIGLHTGSCAAGVVGLKMPRYCIFGDTVNTASRMESNGEPMKIHISVTTKLLLDSYPEFILQHRGNMEIKGKGSMITYWLIGSHE